jgi:uncharacterized protein (DUF2252 family)
MRSAGAEVVQSIRARDAGGESERLALKYKAVREGASAFFRGACHLYFRRLAQGPQPPDAPLAWICGDLHLNNFAALVGANGRAVFAVNDFDECGLAPATYDVLRVASSIYVARKRLGLDKEQASALVAVFVRAFAEAFQRADAGESAPPRKADRTALAFANARALEARTCLVDGLRRLRVDGKYALPATLAQQRAVRALLAGDAAAAQLTVLDLARRVAGLGSLGRERFSILARTDGGGEQLLDLKEARVSAAAPFGGVAQTKWQSEAARVVAVESRCDPALQGTLAAICAPRGAMILRELRPREIRLDLADLGGGVALRAHVTELAQAAARVPARTAGWNGAAQLADFAAFGADRAWQAELATLAVDLARQTKDDWRAFCAAYDEGAVEPERRTAMSEKKS